MLPYGSLSSQMTGKRCQRASTTACCLAASPLKGTTGGTVGFITSLQKHEAILCATSCRTRGPQIESHRPFARPVCGFLQGMTFQDELHRVHEAPTVGALCLGRGGALAEQAHVLDALPQPMVDDFVLPVDQGWDLLAVPAQPALVPVRCRLQMEAQSRAVGLAFDRVESTSLAAEADTTRLAHADSIGRLVGPTRYLLRHEVVEVLREPAGAQAFGRLVQAVFREAIARALTSEGLRTCGFVRTGHT